MDQHIDILKLPPHTTDRLQPLDVCCYKSLKVKWDRNIADWIVKHRAKRVTKSDFLGLVADVYEECFTNSLIKKAFEKCGIYPLNRTMYPTSAFAPNLLNIYNMEKERDQMVSNSF